MLNRHATRIVNWTVGMHRFVISVNNLCTLVTRKLKSPYVGKYSREINHGVRSRESAMVT